MTTNTTATAPASNTTPAKRVRPAIIDVDANGKPITPGVSTPPAADPKAVQATAKAAVAKTTPVVKAAPVTPVIAPKPSPSQKRLDILQFEDDMVHSIALKDIVIPKDGNITRPEGTGEFEDLKAQIDAFGQTVPAIAQRQENGIILLVAGFRRAAALKELGINTIKVRFLRDTSARARILANVQENEDAKRKITPLGRLAAIQALQKEGYSIAQLAVVMGQVEDYIRDTLRIPQGAPAIAKALAIPDGKPGSMAFSGAKFILRVGEGGRALPVGTKVTPEDIKAQEKLFERCLGMNTLAIKAEVEAFKNPEKTITKKADAKGDKTGSADNAPEGVTEKVYLASTVPFMVKADVALTAMDAAISALEKALQALGVGDAALKGAGVTGALADIVKAQLVLNGNANKQAVKVATVVGEKTLKAAVKAEQA